MTIAPIGEGRREEIPGLALRGLRVKSASGEWWIVDGELGRVTSDGARGFVGVVPVPDRVQRVTRRGPRRGSPEVLYLCAFGSREVLASPYEIREGSAWHAAGVSPPGEPRVGQLLERAIVELARYEGDIEAIPYVEHDRLWIPPEPYGPEGYGELAAGATFEGWEGIVALATVNPGLALVLGAAIAGLYVGSIESWENPILHLVGDSSVGKTSALAAGAAVVGDPNRVVKTFGGTIIGLQTTLGELSILPAFYDELDTGKLTERDFEALVYRVANGRGRVTATRYGTTVRGRDYHGILITTGNRTLAHVTPVAGLPARVLEIVDPIFSTAGEADLMQELARAHFGLPVRLLREQLDTAGFDRRRKEYRARIESPDGIIGRLADKAALFVAGAEMLGELFGDDGLGEVALAAVGNLLNRTAADLSAGGRSLGARLQRALADAIFARPHAFPTLEAAGVYKPGEVEGFRDDGRFYFRVPALQAIAKDAGIDDPAPALRQLRDRGALCTNLTWHLTTRRRMGEAGIVDFYVLKFPETDEHKMLDTSLLPRAGARGPRAGAIDEKGAPSSAARGARGARGFSTIRREVDLATLTGAELRELAYLADQNADREAAQRTAALAEVLTAPTIGAYRQAAATASEGVLVVDEAGTVFGAGEVGKGHAGHPSGLAGTIALASERGVGLVWLTVDPALEVLEVPGFEMRPARGGVGWYGWPLLARDRLLRVIIGPADSSPFASIEDPRELLAALEAFRAAHGVNWQGSGGAVFAALQRVASRRRSGNAERAIEPAAVLEARFDAGQSVDWDRKPGSGDHGPWIHTYDRNGAYLSVLGEVAWPEGAPELVVSNFADVSHDWKLPGWWKLAMPDWPADLPRVATPIDGDTIWTTTPGLVFMQRDLELEVTIDAAWIWPNSRQAFRTVQRKLRDARAALVGGGGAAYDAHKLVYSQGVNWWRAQFHEAAPTESGLAEGPAGWHPNAQAQVATLARINAYRSMRKMATPPIASLVVDEYAWLTEEPDPRTFAAANRIELGVELGSWKHARSVSTPVDLGRRYRPGRVRQAILEALDNPVGGA